jgi:hypothetical protein
VAPQQHGGPGGQGERHECLHRTPSDDDPAHGTAGAVGARRVIVGSRRLGPGR